MAIEAIEKVTETSAPDAAKRISRKAALAGVAATAGAAALARVQVGADRAEAAAAYLRPAAELSGAISIYAQAYNPSQSMVKTPNNPIPHHMLQVVIDEYQALHPKVQISIITQPASVTDTRTWEVPVQYAGVS
jgi:ABC-type glycerol-3-phosphate transport system substrate-binding protein